MENAVFIDGHYVYAISKKLGSEINFKELREAFADYFEGPIRIYYYLNISMHKDDTHVPAKPLIDWLSYNGYIIRHKLISDEYFVGESRATHAAQIAVDALTTKANKKIFFINTPELLPVLSECSRTSSIILMSSKVIMSNQDLRQAADLTVEIETIDNKYNNTILKAKG